MTVAMSCCIRLLGIAVFCFKQKTAYEMRISDWSSDVCSSDLDGLGVRQPVVLAGIDGAAALLVAVPFLPGVGGISLAFQGHHLPDGQLVFPGEEIGRAHV